MFEARKTTIPVLQSIFTDSTNGIPSRKQFKLQPEDINKEEMKEFVAQLKNYYQTLLQLPLPDDHLRTWASCEVWTTASTHRPPYHAELRAILANTLWNFYQREQSNNFWSFIQGAAKHILTEAVYVHSYTTSLWNRGSLQGLRDQVYAVCYQHFIPAQSTWQPWIPSHTMSSQKAAQLNKPVDQLGAACNLSDEDIQARVMEESLQWLSGESSITRTQRLKQALALQQAQLQFLESTFSQLLQPGIGTIRLTTEDTAELLAAEEYAQQARKKNEDEIVVDSQPPLIQDSDGHAWVLDAHVERPIRKMLKVSISFST